MPRKYEHFEVWRVPEAGGDPELFDGQGARYETRRAAEREARRRCSRRAPAWEVIRRGGYHHHVAVVFRVEWHGGARRGLGCELLEPVEAEDAARRYPIQGRP